MTTEGPHPRLIRLAREVGAFPAEPPPADVGLDETQPGLEVRRPLARLWDFLKGFFRPEASGGRRAA